MLDDRTETEILRAERDEARRELESLRETVREVYRELTFGDTDYSAARHIELNHFDLTEDPSEDEEIFI